MLLTRTRQIYDFLRLREFDAVVVRVVRAGSNGEATFLVMFDSLLTLHGISIILGFSLKEDCA